MNKVLLTTLLLTISAATAQTQITLPVTAQSAVTPVTPALVTELPKNPKLDRPLTVVLPSGAPLPLVLRAIAQASGLSLIQRDVPPVAVTLSVKGLSSRVALERLLNLYGDRIAGQMIGDTLIVAPPEAIRRLGAAKTVEQTIISQETTEQDAQRVTLLTGAQVVPLRQNTIVSGTAEQVAQAKRLLTASAPNTSTSSGSSKEESPAPIFTASEALGKVEGTTAERTVQALHEGVQVTTAYGRAYLQAGSKPQLDAAVQMLVQLRDDAAREPAQAAPAASANASSVPERRVISTMLGSDVVARLVAASGNTEMVALDTGTYQFRGPAAALDELRVALREAEAREAMRVTVSYAGGSEEDLTGLRSMLPNITARLVSGGIEVRGTPQEHLRVSSYLKSVLRPTPKTEEEIVTLRLALAYANPATVAGHLSNLYGTAPGNTGGAAAGPATSGPAASTASSNTPAAQAGNALAGVATASGTPVTGTTNVTLQGNVRIIADERTRSLIVTGPASQVVRIQRTVSDLDIRLNDIRMALRIEQVSGTSGQDLGLNWSVGAGGLSIGQKDGSLTAGFTPGIKPLSFEASLQAARTQGRVNTLLDTSFVAQDGRTNTFRNGGQLLLPSTNTTTGNGSTTTSTSRESYNYGLDVSLTPRLAPDGRVELDVRVQLGQAPRTGVQNGVVIEQQTLNTQVNLRPGEPVILGSVLQNNASSSSKGVPVLSDIPVVGTLFGTRGHTQDNSVLLITIQAADREDSRAPSVPTSSGAGVTRVTLPGR